MIVRAVVAWALIVGLVPVAGCGAGNEKPAPQREAVQNQPGKTTTVDTSCDPKIDPAKFTDNVTNPYLPWKPGEVGLHG